MDKPLFARAKARLMETIRKEWWSVKQGLNQCAVLCRRNYFIQSPFRVDCGLSLAIIERPQRVKSYAHILGELESVRILTELQVTAVTGGVKIFLSQAN